MHFLWKMTAGPKAMVFFFILCRNCHRLHSCRLSLSWWKNPDDSFSHKCKGQRGCHWSLSLLLSHRLNCKLVLTSYGLKNIWKGFPDSLYEQDLTLIVLKVAVLLNWSISLTWKYLNVKKKFMLKLQCHLLLLSVHLLQWFSASSLSSTPLWTTLSKFTMGQLSIPVFSALSPVHTQVRIHKISFWCNLQRSSCLYCNRYQTWSEHVSSWGLNFSLRGGGYNNYYYCLSLILFIRIWLNLKTNGSQRPSRRACRWAPVICKTIQHWRQQFSWYICSLKKYRNIIYEKEKHKHFWPNKPLNFLLVFKPLNSKTTQNIICNMAPKNQNTQTVEILFI